MEDLREFKLTVFLLYYIMSRDPLIMSYFDNLDNGLLNKYIKKSL
jgi:hypothetical protein